LVKAFATTTKQSLDMRIVNTELTDGAELQADINHVTLPWLTVLLVDDEGMISDVSKNIAKQDNTYRLRAPIHLSGNGKGKNQLLIAVSAAQKLDLLEFQGKARADDIFPFAMGERKRKNIATEVSISVFRVR
jgi:hypothetical protein